MWLSRARSPCHTPSTPSPPPRPMQTEDGTERLLCPSLLPTVTHRTSEAGDESMRASHSIGCSTRASLPLPLLTLASRREQREERTAHPPHLCLSSQPRAVGFIRPFPHKQPSSLCRQYLGMISIVSLPVATVQRPICIDGRRKTGRIRARAPPAHGPRGGVSESQPKKEENREKNKEGAPSSPSPVRTRQRRRCAHPRAH